MLQKQVFHATIAGDDQTNVLTPGHIYDIAKRRWLYFTIPFVLIVGIGSAIAMLLPATFLAQGKILVESPQIPSDLVQPTVAVLANERIQIIQQRISTRDNLLALAKKYHLTTDWQGRVAGTDLVDFIKSRIAVAPYSIDPVSTDTVQPRKKKQDTQAVAFTVGFTYENPDIATKVANELMTMILNEDIRGRTASATEATRFLTEEAKRLEAKINIIDAQIVSIAPETGKAATAAKTPLSAANLEESNNTTTLAKLKAELALKSATYSPEHPDIKSLKRKIAAFESGATPMDPAAAADTATSNGADATQKVQKDQTGKDSPTSAPSPASTAAAVGLDALKTQKANLHEELNDLSKKLAAARLGENLERGQYAERLQVLEQPTIPDLPVSPNRPKILAIAFAFAIAASGGLVVLAELLNPAIRRASDLYSVIDSHLIVAIPYIKTRGDTRRRKRKLMYTGAACFIFVASSIVVVVFMLPPLDVVVAKLFPGLAY